ncbi:GTP pyrophosphokinase [Intestinibaculum porci]|jgi:putative GTP pyrophosphokinase|uniref:GTP pyrophosphokinase n=1 Tax=Intestinibaculum porci TaxID=2487118 RepID=UPI00240A1E0D|nr:GTP pyrophosphokinase family protein [Intestinibaculum porci]MDD6349180.1 GTP pyrophosphokinase family protein [Intestinibaculum porci]MDD6422173.1 GTP pyrophosphokinase family protein [Intestinibaculum porci]
MDVKDIALERFLSAIKSQMDPVQELFTYYRCAIMEVETKFRVLDEQFSLQYDDNPIESIKSRIKSYDSILRKLKRKGISFDLDSIQNEIFDIAGIRVICSFEKDIYMLADYLLAQDDITLIERKDYIKNPKPSGYRSLHLIVEVPIFLSTGKKMMKVEVQLRTIAMDFWASLEHKLRYKKNLSPKQLEMLSDEMKTCADMTKDLDRRMQYVRDEMNREKEG